MKRFSLIIVFLLTSFVSISAQAVDGKEIIDRDIEWSDFVGSVNTSSEFDAVTNWAITYVFSRPTFQDNRAQVNVTVHVFFRSNSWVKSNKKTPRLLNHERGHFKIAKICAEEIEETINSRSFDRNNYAKEINEAYWAILNKYIEFEKQYDSETDHYKNQAQQTAWDKKLNDLLQ